METRARDFYDTEDTPTCSTYRAEVPGGWLVAVWSGHTNADKYKKTNLQTFGGGVTFVSDPLHAWKLDLHPEPQLRAGLKPGAPHDEVLALPRSDSSDT